MHRRALPAAGLLLLVAVSAVLAEAPPNLEGQSLYLAWCASCHGADGKGDGPAGVGFAKPPTDFTAAGYMAKTTDAQIAKVLSEGMDYRLKLPEKMPHFVGEFKAGDVDRLIAYLRKLPDIDWNKALEGRKPFMNHCALCHGAEGQGNGPRRFRGPDKPADLNPTMKNDFQLFKKDFVQGKHRERTRMFPHFPASEEDLGKIFAYIQIFTPGRPIYEHSCVQCHGEEGEGVVGLYEKDKSLKTKSIADRTYLQNTSDEDLKKIILSGEQYVKDLGGGVAHFQRTLDKEEVAAVIKYMRANF